jgi:hypothetical protein
VLKQEALQLLKKKEKTENIIKVPELLIFHRVLDGQLDFFFGSHF